MKTISRSQAIEMLRREFLKLVDEDCSLCLVAARRGIFCNGFGRWDDAELAKRFPWILHREPGCSRSQVEHQANRWQLGAQSIPEGRLPCDVEHRPHSLPCAGWDEFYEKELAQFYLEMCGEEVRVVPDGFVDSSRD